MGGEDQGMVDGRTDVAEFGVHAAAFGHVGDACVAEVDELVGVVSASVVGSFMVSADDHSSRSWLNYFRLHLLPNHFFSSSKLETL